jgi:hypothetical protein
MHLNEAVIAAWHVESSWRPQFVAQVTSWSAAVLVR